MKIGKETQARTSICTSNADTIVVRGLDLCQDVIGRFSFTEYFFLLLTGKRPDGPTLAVLDATLVAIAEHGLVPSVQAARMTYAASPEALQGAVAAGLLGCGSVILGASAQAGELFIEIEIEQKNEGLTLNQAAASVLRKYKDLKKPIPGYGHPLHKARDPRVAALFDVSRATGAGQAYIEIAEAVEKVMLEVIGKPLNLNVSAAIPAVLLGVGFPVGALKGIPILARSAGLIAHLHEERESPIGFALSYQATREVIYEGETPRSFKSE